MEEAAVSRRKAERMDPTMVSCLADYEKSPLIYRTGQEITICPL